MMIEVDREWLNRVGNEWNEGGCKQTGERKREDLIG